jgi:hypothetical protein
LLLNPIKPPIPLFPVTEPVLHSARAHGRGQDKQVASHGLFSAENGDFDCEKAVFEYNK